MNGPDQRDLQRLRYRQGQSLLREDFQDQQSIESQLRAWHNRALHNTFGVVGGFAAGLTVSVDAVNNRATVEPGLAYDCFGRDLFLQRRASILLPEETGESMLLICRKNSRSCSPRNQSATACLSESRRRVEDEPEFIWKPEKFATIRDGVPIARLPPKSESGDAIELDPDFAVRQSRALARPRIVQGATIPGATVWEVWRLEGRNQLPAFAASFQVRIDAASAGFTMEEESRFPAYFARLQGPLSKLNDQQEIEFGGVYLSHIDEISNSGFTFRFLIAVFNSPGGKLTPVSDARAFLQQNEFFVSWLGIEMNQDGDF